MMHFLIVGHTHNVIDQYFSVISKKIFKAEFIATPYALHALILQTNDDESDKVKDTGDKSDEVLTSNDGKSKKLVPAFCKFIEVRDISTPSSLILTLLVAGGL
jgi:hypothetical protein